MSYPVRCVKKLIEVGIPLNAINEECDKQSSNPFLKGHPRSLHIWWARRPLAAARAVIFCQLVNDPSGRWELENPDSLPPNNLKASWAAKRKQLFQLIEELILWKNNTNEEVLKKARNEIKKSWREVCDLNKDHPDAAELFNPDKLPGLHDPFAGGGAIPLEAQRLGLEAYASDLNPVAVLINKAMIEIPKIFTNKKPIGSLLAEEEELGFDQEWSGNKGFAEDIRRYGAWVNAEAKRRIGNLYPQINITKKMAATRPDLELLIGHNLTVIAYIWTRTVKSPNPIYRHIDVPLASTFILSRKDGSEVYLHPNINEDHYKFTIITDKPPLSAQNGTKSASSRSPFLCLLSKTPISFEYIREEAKFGRMGLKMMAIVVDSNRGKLFLEPSIEMESIAQTAIPQYKPDILLPQKALGFRIQEYGMIKWSDLFTPRQLVALSTYSDLVQEVIENIRNDALLLGIEDDNKGLDNGGTGALAYSQAIGVYLGMAVSKWADMMNTICTWNNTNNNISHLFSKQAIPMSWDFVELSAFSPIAGYDSLISSIVELFPTLPANNIGLSEQIDAQTQKISLNKIISTDPPYFDNIGYADLSDFFYVWLRKILSPIYPKLFSTIAVPKKDELIASPFRHESKENAESFFLEGMTTAMRSLSVQAHPEMPVTIYYARKQTAKKEEDALTGWETFLEAVVRSGFLLTGTWPMRTEREARSVGQGTNALASSIILVCRRRPVSVKTTTSFPQAVF